MRKAFLSLAFLAAAGLAALTPGEASAWGRWTYYTPSYYGGYYSAPTYYTPAPYYTTSPYGGYTYAPAYSAPVVSSYYAPTYGAPVYSAPVAPAYYYSPGYSYYYGPRYDRSFAAWAPYGYVYP